MIPQYNHNSVASIAAPKVGHTRNKGDVGVLDRRMNIPDPTPRKVLARDIKELQRVYGGDIQDSDLRSLIDLNKQMYPNSFVKQPQPPKK